MTDGTAVAVALGGSRGAALDPRLAEYVRGQWPALVRYATALCGDAAEAEELVQSALVRVALRWTFVRDKENPDGYVRRTIVRANLTLWSRVRSRETRMADLPEPATDDPVSRVADVVTVRRAIAGLPARQRAVLVLRYLEDRSEAETADILECSIGTVKSQTSKAFARLRVVLSDGDVA